MVAGVLDCRIAGAFVCWCCSPSGELARASPGDRRQGRERRAVCDTTMSTSLPTSRALFMHNGILSNCPVQWGLHPSYAALLDAISCSRQGNKLFAKLGASPFSSGRGGSVDEADQPSFLATRSRSTTTAATTHSHAILFFPLHTLLLAPTLPSHTTAGNEL